MQICVYCGFPMFEDHPCESWDADNAATQFGTQKQFEVEYSQNLELYDWLCAHEDDDQSPEWDYIPF